MTNLHLDFATAIFSTCISFPPIPQVIINHTSALLYLLWVAGLSHS
jgi:hypothetical protein